MTDPFRQIAIDLDVHRAIERHRQALCETENEILRRLVLPARGRAAGVRGPAPGIWSRMASSAPRSRGLWSVEVGGRKIPAANLKDAYRRLLRELAAAHPQFLDAFAGEKGRTRRPVARTPTELYGQSRHLARHAELLVEGWYFDSNLSAARAGKLARIAARLCGLYYGPDVRILDNLREL